MSPDRLTVPARFCGPPGAANGGYLMGRMVGRAAGVWEITLRRPVPLDRPLPLTTRGGTRVLSEGGEVLAETYAATLPDLLPPPPVTPDAAARAAQHYLGHRGHPFPGCFVCGTGREPGDGLRLFAGPLPEGGVAAPWTPAAELADARGRVHPEFVWAALDCPGAFAVISSPAEAVVLGRLTGEVLHPPVAGEPHMVQAWDLGTKDRRRFAGTALYDAAGRVLARARAVWFRLDGVSG